MKIPRSWWFNTGDGDIKRSWWRCEQRMDIIPLDANNLFMERTEKHRANLVASSMAVALYEKRE